MVHTPLHTPLFFLFPLKYFCKEVDFDMICTMIMIIKMAVNQEHSAIFDYFRYPIGLDKFFITEELFYHKKAVVLGERFFKQRKSSSCQG